MTNSDWIQRIRWQLEDIDQDIAVFSHKLKRTEELRETVLKRLQEAEVAAEQE